MLWLSLPHVSHPSAQHTALQTPAVQALRGWGTVPHTVRVSRRCSVFYFRPLYDTSGTRATPVSICWLST